MVNNKIPIIIILLCMLLAVAAIYVIHNIEEPITKEQIQNEEIIKLSIDAKKNINTLDNNIKYSSEELKKYNSNLIKIYKLLEEINKRLIEINNTETNTQCTQQLLPQ